MNESTNRIVTLAPLRVASVYGFGPEPEAEAWRQLAAWAGPKGYLDDPAQHRVFGFNNPSPAPSSPNYGYELWIAVGPDEQGGAGVRILEFAGGLYAVARCAGAGDPGVVIPAAWKRLVGWREDGPYQEGHHQWLEEHLPAAGPGLIETPAGPRDLDLYLPIA